MSESTSVVAKANPMVHFTDQDEMRIKLENFNKFLDKKPHVSKIKKNELANNSLYLPIEVIENKLNEVFMGLWETIAVVLV